MGVEGGRSRLSRARSTGFPLWPRCAPAHLADEHRARASCRRRAQRPFRDPSLHPRGVAPHHRRPSVLEPAGQQLRSTAVPDGFAGADRPRSQLWMIDLVQAATVAAMQHCGTPFRSGECALGRAPEPQGGQIAPGRRGGAASPNWPAMNASSPTPLLAAYLRRRGQLVGYFQVRLGSREAAEELVQDLFVRIARLPAAIDHPDTFLFRVGANLMLDRMKHARRARKHDAAWQGGTPRSEAARRWMARWPPTTPWMPGNASKGSSRWCATCRHRCVRRSACTSSRVSATPKPLGL
jgi:hypothetical protein